MVDFSLNNSTGNTTSLYDLYTKKSGLENQKSAATQDCNTKKEQKTVAEGTVSTSKADYEDKNAKYNQLSSELANFQVPDSKDEPQRADFTTTDETGNQVFDSASFDAEFAEYKKSVDAHDKALEEKEQLEANVKKAKAETTEAQKANEDATANLQTATQDYNASESNLKQINDQLSDIQNQINDETMKSLTTNTKDVDMEKLMSQKSDVKGDDKNNIDGLMSSFVKKDDSSLLSDISKGVTKFKDNITKFGNLELTGGSLSSKKVSISGKFNI